MFFFKVKNKFLKRVVRVSEKIGISQEKVIERALEKGLNLTERKIGRSERGRLGQELSQEEIDFIKRNWQKMSDGDMARKLGESRWVVMQQRFSLGFSRQTVKTTKSQIDPEWLKRALDENGLTQADVSEKFGVTRERIRQICDELEIKVKRTPPWYANRYGKPEFADREWFEGQLKETGGAMALSRKFNISNAFIKIQAKRLGIDRSLVRYHAEVVQVNCSYCDKIIKRKSSYIRPFQKFFFCDKVCQGKWFGTQPKKRKFSP